MTFDIKDIEDHYRLYLEPEFSSSTENHRENIRQHIIEKNDLTAEEQKQILDLTQLPRPKNFYVSIAHAKELGGYAISELPIGFDIEDINRISVDTIKRICEPEEKRGVPDVRVLWVVKEALVKLFSKNRVGPPPIITDFKILECPNHEFKAIYKDSEEALGIIRKDENHVMAIAFKKN